MLAESLYQDFETMKAETSNMIHRCFSTYQHVIKSKPTQYELIHPNKLSDDRLVLYNNYQQTKGKRKYILHVLNEALRHLRKRERLLIELLHELENSDIPDEELSQLELEHARLKQLADRYEELEREKQDIKVLMKTQLKTLIDNEHAFKETSKHWQSEIDKITRKQNKDNMFKAPYQLKLNERKQRIIKLKNDVLATFSEQSEAIIDHAELIVNKYFSLWKQ